ncbi:MAG: selenocysteine-specific translation elongation factor [Alphaproteobacteria bacterium]|jgi:selenocysteine-specific elongation factor|nr:selenocysteine-specific translation elongation factor [Rhodospirillaceae bacterium]MBT6203423.1 selenocysteine-specific translation elongation factor [Rhodospirillaceae bacterium]MBT6509362.1 selenocysteine-specific translation elongation factor [Rhodospirillaceae bacterium]MBT7646060.1 selenocysteine-specific translation elongation factor [Rhodospirillaceae bacterium]MDG2481963.1 selenocysteine-specific translation elongation factor [Alphaproteobacteria bacterium]
MIVATAGHVDHGKTSLIHALTGIDTDRLPEEKKRGLTIDLGFAYLALPSGDVIGFIDVPGHERFVRNMVAGVAGIDLGLVVVAADDGVMPQTREHVAVLGLLGVTRVVVAVTKIDRVEPTRTEQVGIEVRELLEQAGMTLVGLVETAAPVYRGIDALREILVNETTLLAQANTEGGFRLAVDRVFIVKGAGVVVTGTVHAGRVENGGRLTLMPSGREVRVRTIHAQDQPSSSAGKGDRAALNLAGIDQDEVVRGDWVVTRGLLKPSLRIDVMLEVLAGETTALKHWTPVHVHHGSGRSTGRIAILEGGSMAPGESGLAQIVVDEPLMPVFADRIVLRDQSARRTIAGGRVIDPHGPVRGRAKPQRIAWLRAADRQDPAAALDALLVLSPGGVDAGGLAQTRNLTDYAGLVERLSGDALSWGRSGGHHLILREHWDVLITAVLAAVAADHENRQDRLGPSLPVLRAALASRPGQDLLDAVVRELVTQERLSRRGAIIHQPDHTVELAGKDREPWKAIEKALVVESGSPPALFPLADQVSLSPGDLERFLERMAGFGLVVKIAHNRYLTPAQIEAAERSAQRTAQDFPDGFSAAQFRDVAGIGRNLAIDLLEHLDRTGVTRRLGDLRMTA